MNSPVIIPVILCGGSGTRLWPASRENHPKQFLNLIDDFSLLQNTLKRALRITGAPAEQVVTVTLGALANAVRDQMREIDPAAARHVLCEPTARNTAAAIAYAARYVADVFGDDAMMWVLASDHHIGDEHALMLAYRDALAIAGQGYLATFGIRPTRPETGYGYILTGEVFSAGQSACRAVAFVEKPGRETAQTYLEDGRYLWNSGMFLFRAGDVISEFTVHCPDILDAVNHALALSDMAQAPDADSYAAIRKEPFDVAIMEKTGKVAVVPCNPRWSDVGSWESLWEMQDKDQMGNATQGRAACYESRDCLVRAADRLVACVGVSDIVVVETEDAVLVADRRNSDAMKILVNGLKKTGAREIVDPPAVPQAWSMTKTLPAESGMAAREIVLVPGETVEFAPHDLDSKLWTVIEGSASTVLDGVPGVLAELQSVMVPAGVKASVANASGAVVRIIEVASGPGSTIRLGARPAREAA